MVVLNGWAEVLTTGALYRERGPSSVPFSEFRKGHAARTGISERDTLAHGQIWYCLAILCEHIALQLRNSERSLKQW